MATVASKCSEKWKTKRRQRASAARMREIRAAKLQVAEASHTEASSVPSTSGSASTPAPEPSTPTPVVEEEECEPESSGSENERPGTDSGSDDEDFDPQVAFDNWIVSLRLSDRKMLSVLLMETLQKRFKIKATAAALEAAWITGFNEKTVRYYRKDFMDNKGKFKEEKRGKHKRVCLFNDEDLRLQASMWVREYAVNKSGPNMTARNLCQWVNETLLPSSNLPPFFPRSITVITATRWLHRLGYRPKSHKKGAYVDGHERQDVVDYRSKYLNMMKQFYDTHLPPPAPSDEMAPVPPPDAEYRKKLVLIFHDECIFSTNEGQLWAWATENDSVIQPKTKGTGIMISDYIDQHNGFLRLTDAEIQLARSSQPTFPTTARATLEYGADKGGYWNSQKFLTNVKDAIKIAKFKYPEDKHTVVFVFDSSSCHRAYAPDALNAKTMNVKPGGAQPPLRDTTWAGRVQKLVDSNGVPKGMKQVLNERGINTATLKANDMREILSNHSDFLSEKTMVEHLLESEGLKGTFLPNFHCELNPIERVWGQAKKYSRAHTNFTLVQLRTIIDPALDSVPTDLIRKYFRRVKEYERAYLDGKKAGKELEQAVKVFKSHRRIFFEQ